MSKIIGTAFAITLTLTLSLASASAWNFTYTYQTVDSLNSSNYIVSMQHIQTYNEWTGSSYWGPNANDVLGCHNRNLCPHTPPGI